MDLFCAKWPGRAGRSYTHVRRTAYGEKYYIIYTHVADTHDAGQDILRSCMWWLSISLSCCVGEHIVHVIALESVSVSLRCWCCGLHARVCSAIHSNEAHRQQHNKRAFSYVWWLQYVCVYVILFIYIHIYLYRIQYYVCMDIWA